MESSEGSTGSTELLKNKYNLHDSPEVKTAALRAQQRTGERVPQNPLARIQNYLNRFHEIIDQKDSRRGEHGLDLIKGRFHARYVIKPDEVPEAYFANQKRLAREQGHGDIEITPEARSQLTEVIIADQRSSLDKWIDYLSSPDAPYPDALKYFTLRSVVNMAEYDKERKRYPERSKGTTKPFPDLNREALAYVLDAVEKKYKKQTEEERKNEEEKRKEEEKRLTPEEKEQREVEQKEFERLLAGENFAKLYAWAIEKVTPASQEELSATKGEWIKYNQNSDPIPLVKSLQGHGTGWCTAGESTAAVQLQGGDFYAYYSNDRNGRPTVPRAAIRMEGSRIAEVRGIGSEQNLDPGAIVIVEEKLKEFPDGPSYQKKVSDMRRLTAIENLIKEGQSPTGADLVFLYEIDSSIEGFGYKKDPRIAELISPRNPEEDMLIIFECSKEQIAHNPEEINENTRAYVGPVCRTDSTGSVLAEYKNIFKKLNHIEHVYTSFPEGKIRIEELAIGGRSKEQLRKDLRQGNIQVSPNGEYMIKMDAFKTLDNSKIIKTVRLKIQDLGLQGAPTTDQVYTRADELGLDLCLPEVGVYQRLKDTNQPLRNYYFIGMKQITDHHGHPSVFHLERREGGVWLYDSRVEPGDEWLPSYKIIFSLRKSDVDTLAA